MTKDFNSLASIENIGAMLKTAIAESECITLHRDGSFSAYFDNKADDTRVVVNYHSGHMHYSIQALHGFDTEKNMWQVTGRSGRRDLPNKRGVTSIAKTFKTMAQAFKGYFPNMLFLYRRQSGEWYAN
jgi:hypothetical protein